MSKSRQVTIICGPTAIALDRSFTAEHAAQDHLHPHSENRRDDRAAISDMLLRWKKREAAMQA